MTYTPTHRFCCCRRAIVVENTELFNFFPQYIISAENKGESESKGKTSKAKKEPASMFQINGDKPDFIAKKKGNFTFLKTHVKMQIYIYKC